MASKICRGSALAIPPTLHRNDDEECLIARPVRANHRNRIVERQLAYGGGGANGEFALLEHDLVGNPVSTFRDHGLDI
jgi:hypothetical protein